MIPTLPTAMVFQSVVTGNPSHAAPSAGIIVSFSHIAEASPDSTLALVVLRPVGTDFSVVAVSDAKTLTGGVMNTFATRIKVQAGDIIGVLGSSGSLGAASPAGLPTNTMSASGVTPTVGMTYLSGSLGSFSDYIVDISASLEADADGDGFGDETQDLCPTQAATQGACDLTGPVLTLKFSKTQKTKKSFTLTATPGESGTTTLSGKLTYKTMKNGKKVTKTIKLKSVTRTLTAGTAQKFTFTLSSKAKTALKKAGKLTASLTFSSTDSLGNKSTKKATITVKRK